MNKKRIISISTLIVVVAIVIGIVYKTKEAVNHTKVTKKQDYMISLMLETEANSGKYEVSTLSSFPTDGYIFNSNLSGCENGGKLIWDDVNNNVVMKGNVSDKCYLYFDKYELAKINNASAEANGNKIDMSITAQAGTGAIAKYFYSKDDGASYVESTTANYTFSGLAKGTYKIKMYVEDVNGKKSDVVSKTVEITVIPLAEYIMSLYTNTQGTNGLYYHTSSLANSASDNSYRYAGANPNNYICFGSEATTCPSDNLYRIVGVFDDKNHGVSGEKLVKIIKNATYGTHNWDSTSATWSSSSIRTYLNTNFVNEKLSGYTDKIATVSWKVSGHNNALITTKSFFDTEVKNATSTYSGKIGLMYVSDYGFAALPTYWSSNVGDYSSAAYNYDFLYKKSYTQWTITLDTTGGAFYVGSNGDASSGSFTNTYTVFPAFYLESSVGYLSGTGTSSDPMRVS